MCSLCAVKKVSTSHTHRYKLETKPQHILFFLFFSWFGNCRVNIFINHITWHDAPKFTLFTGIHLIEHKVSQWIYDWRFAHCTYNSEWHFPNFSLIFFCLSLKQSPSRSYPNNSKTSWWSDKGILLCNCHGGFFYLFTNTICRNSTHTGYVSEYKFCSTVVNSQYKSATYTMLYAVMIIIIISFIILHYYGNKYSFLHKSWQQIRHGDAHVSRSQNSKLYRRMNFYLQ